MSVKRPRIDPELAAAIDATRGRLSFEGAVADALETYLALHVVDRPGHKPRPATDSELMLNLLRSDRFMSDDRRFRAAFDEAMARWQEETGQQARKAGHEAPQPQGEVDGERR